LQAVLGAEHLRFHLLEFRRYEAFSIDKRLLADVIRRHIALVGFGDFDVIAEHPVEADLEGLDAGAQAFRFLQLCDPLLAAAHGLAHFVEFF
jgi:hypothetical protein